MGTEQPGLEMFRHEWIDEVEERRFRRLTGGQDHEMPDATVETSNPLAISRESTATLRAFSEVDNSRGWHASDAGEDEMDIDGIEQRTLSDAEKILMPMVVATDFGTTFSSMAFARRGEGMLPDVKIVDGYPNDPRYNGGNASLQVPTESWYPNEPKLEEASRSPTPLQQHFARGGSPANIYDAESDDERNLDEQLMPDDEIQLQESLPRAKIRSFVWGYGIESEITQDMEQSKFNRIARSKLLLDKSDHTAQVRNELEPILRRLKRKRVISENEDVIADYLARLFIHTKTELKRENHISDATPIEHILTVPAIWTADACRKMQKAMAVAIEQAQFGTAQNLFLVSEPEAAATYVLSQYDAVSRGEAFLLLDAGGGTVDATTYRVDNEFPLRLSKELVPPDGCLKGSSYLNEAFREHLRQRLAGEEHDIEKYGFTVEGIIETAVLRFEREVKRRVDVTERVTQEHIVIHGLQENTAKRFKRNKLLIDRADFVEIFKPCLLEIKSLMRSQLISARRANHKVKKVILIGGFGISKSLQSYLREALKEFSREFNYKGGMSLITTKDLSRKDPEVAVSHGAILRAWNKEDGPTRITKSSYGFQIMEEYSPETIKEHLEVKKPFYDKLDGRYYVRDTIEWHVFKGQTVPTQAEYSLPSVYRIFQEKAKNFRCEENLWVSDEDVASHYKLTHLKNKGAEKAGTIVADMGPLVRAGKIPLTVPEDGYEGKPHYKIEFELIMIINGRNLRFEARWPKGGEVRAQTQICIAAAFRPGTD